MLLIFVTLGMNLPFDALEAVPLRWAPGDGGLHLRVPAGDRLRVPPAGPAGTLVAQRDDLPELVPLHGGHPGRRGSILLARGVEGAEIAVSLVALAVVTTLLLQATTAGLVARRLGLIEATERPETETSTPRTG